VPADALVELARRALAGQCCAGGGLPETGGEAATVLVTLSLDALRTGLGCALLPTGDPISAEAARRWACDARSSSPPCSTASRCRWTSGGPAGCSPPPNAKRSPCGTGTAARSLEAFPYSAIMKVVDGRR
jgi:Domain of unknown function (DUF222)